MSCDTAPSQHLYMYFSIPIKIHQYINGMYTNQKTKADITYHTNLNKNIDNTVIQFKHCMIETHNFIYF